MRSKLALSGMVALSLSRSLAGHAAVRSPPLPRPAAIFYRFHARHSGETRNAYVYESFSLKHLGLYAFHNFTSRSRLLSVTQISLDVA